MYVKLFGSILDSSIWVEGDNPTRLLWITLLAMANKHGFVEAAVPGLAHRARITMDECGKALETLEAPDLHSKNPDWGGRRIEKVEGGWHLLNYQKYREIQTQRQKDDAARKRRKYAETRTEGVEISATSAPNANATANANLPDATAPGAGEPTAGKASSKPRKPRKKPETPSWTQQACDDWIARYGGTAPGGRIGKALKPLVAQHGWEKIRPIWQAYLAEKDAEFASAQDFASKLGLWATKGGASGIDRWLERQEEPA